MTRPFRFSIQASAPRPAAEWRELGRRAEDLGYSALSVSDHLDTEMAPLIALAVTAEATRNLRLMTLVLSNDFRHPAFLAKQAATLDLLSDGRLELGVGAGWKTSDYEQSGIPLDRPGIRIERLAEAITVLKGCFADGPFDFDGEHYTIRGLDGQPACVQRPHPPILLAGGGRRMLTLAATPGRHRGPQRQPPCRSDRPQCGAFGHNGCNRPEVGVDERGRGRPVQPDRTPDQVHVASITDDPEGIADLMAPALGISAEEALASPHVLVGSEGQCVETLLAWRERWGLTYIGINEDSMVASGPWLRP